MWDAASSPRHLPGEILSVMILPTAQLVAQTGQLCDAALEHLALHKSAHERKKANNSFCALALGQYMFLFTNLLVLRFACLLSYLTCYKLCFCCLLFIDVGTKFLPMYLHRPPLELSSMAFLLSACLDRFASNIFFMRRFLNDPCYNLYLNFVLVYFRISPTTPVTKHFRNMLPSSVIDDRECAFGPRPLATTLAPPHPPSLFPSFRPPPTLLSPSSFHVSVLPSIRI